MRCARKLLLQISSESTIGTPEESKGRHCSGKLCHSVFLNQIAKHWYLNQDSLQNHSSFMTFGIHATEITHHHWPSLATRINKNITTKPVRHINHYFEWVAATLHPHYSVIISSNFGITNNKHQRHHTDGDQNHCDWIGHRAFDSVFLFGRSFLDIFHNGLSMTSKLPELSPARINDTNTRSNTFG
jgi:hypothetical protein